MSSYTFNHLVFIYSTNTCFELEDIKIKENDPSPQGNVTILINSLKAGVELFGVRKAIKAEKILEEKSWNVPW